MARRPACPARKRHCRFESPEAHRRSGWAARGSGRNGRPCTRQSSLIHRQRAHAGPWICSSCWAADLLSGFLITQILLGNRTTGERSWTFWLSRAARIFPVYYLTAMVVWLATRDALAPWAAVYLSNYRYGMTGAPSPLNHTWSLCIEEHFYLIWPFVVGAVSPDASRRAIVALIVGGATIPARSSTRTSAVTCRRTRPRPSSPRQPGGRPGSRSSRKELRPRSGARRAPRSTASAASTARTATSPCPSLPIMLPAQRRRRVATREHHRRARVVRSRR